MQHIIQEIVDTLEGFVESDERAVMLIEAKTDEAPLLLKTFGMVEESETSPDVFLSFGDDFQDVRKYTELVIERQQEQIELVNIELEKIGQPKLQPLPENITNREALSLQRFIGLMKHLRQTVESERQIIWIIYPLNDVAKEELFTEFFGKIAKKILKKEIEGTKLIIRDTPANGLRKLLYKDDEKTPEIQLYKPELDFKSVLGKIEKQANNPNAPAEEKIQSVMLMAGVDVAEKRYDDALSKNKTVLTHYKKTKQKQNESVVRCNIGDIYYLQGDFPTAQKSYEKAIGIAVEEKSQPLVLYQSINLGNAHFMQKNFDEAFLFYDSAEKLADANKVLVQRVQARERMGDTRIAQNKTAEGIEIYEKTAEICRENKYKLGLQGVLIKLRDVFKEKGDNGKHDEIVKELRQVQADLRKIDPHFVQD